MKSTAMAIALFSCLVGSALPAAAQTATPQVQPTNPGPWQPIALVNPRQNLRIQIVNRTGTSLDYGLTTNEAPPRQLQVGATASLNQFALPAYLLINSTESQVSLKFDVQTQGNVITVEVSQRKRLTPGDTTLNINAQGGIYVY